MTSDQTAAVRESAPLPTKVAWIVGIALATLVPSLLVTQLVGERETRAAAVTAEIAAAWGPEQVVSGPTLVLPVTAKDGSTRYLLLAPRALDTTAIVSPTIRRRGLFAATVYETTMTTAGRFELPDGFREGGPDKMKPGRPFVLLGLASIRGVRDDDHLAFAGIKSAWQACSDVLPDETACRRDDGLLVAGVDLAKSSETGIPFTLTVHLRGTGSLRITTAAKHAMTQIAGAWPTPSFVGTDLPTNTNVTPSGFEANWMLDRIGRPAYTQTALPAALSGASSTSGVDFIEATPLYRTLTRVTKYSLLVVVLAFSVFFLFELVAGSRVALFQYGMLGASLSLFTLLLLSFGEIIGYEAGYAICALMVTAQASLYALSVTRQPRAAAGFAAMLTSVFGFFYALVGLESYSLVVGTVALFLVLSIVMTITEKVGGGGRSVAGRRETIVGQP